MLYNTCRRGPIAGLQHELYASLIANRAVRGPPEEGCRHFHCQLPLGSADVASPNEEDQRRKALVKPTPLEHAAKEVVLKQIVSVVFNESVF